MRAIFEALGATVQWDAQTQTIVGKAGNQNIVLRPGVKTANIAGRRVTLDSPPALVNGRIVVPIRFVAESLNATVRWDRQANEISILLPNAKPYQGSPEDNELIARVSPAVVTITTNRRIGSGFFVSPEGFILTNAHVVRGASQITVMTHQGQRLSATITRITDWNDLALLAVEAPPGGFPYLRHRTDDSILSGERVFAFGGPTELRQRVTSGTIEKQETWDVSLGSWDAGNIPIIRHNASLSYGNSGGPLVNMRGEWIGVNTLQLPEADGDGAAVPVEQYRTLLRWQDYGAVCEWFGYHTEEHAWRTELKRVYRTTVRTLDPRKMPWQRTDAEIALFVHYFTALRSIYARVQTFHVSSPQIAERRRLLVASLRDQLVLIAWQIDVFKRGKTADDLALSLTLAHNTIESYNAFALEIQRQHWHASPLQVELGLNHIPLITIDVPPRSATR